MSNTDSAYFIPLFKFLVQNNIYIPKQNNNTDGWNYLDLMEELERDTNLSIDLQYREYTKYYTKKSHILQIDYEWIYYYLYVILLIDERLDLFESIIDILINGEFTKLDKINKIKIIMANCGKTPDVLDGWMEGYILELMELMIQYGMEDEFRKITSDLLNSPLESYQGCITYLLESIGLDNKDKKLSKYIGILKREGI